MPAPFLAFVAVWLLAACSAGGPAIETPAPEAPTVNTPTPSPARSNAPDTAAAPAAAKTETATFAGGCYWCIEAVFEQIPGVLDAKSGFMGGKTENPSYDDVCSGRTGHAEVVQITFDPAKVTYAALLDWFWRAHDPTTLNRQGADAGTQYRSAIFVHSPEQRAAAEASKAAAQKDFRDPIVTEIADASAFTEADAHHQDFYAQNRQYGYCRVVIAPKLHKLGLKE